MFTKRCTRFMALLLAFVMVCGATVFMNPKQASAASRLDQKEKYTYRDYNSYPSDGWNPHTQMGSNITATMYGWYLSSDFVIKAWTDIEGDEWEFRYYAATNIQDITATFKDKAKWGVEPLAKEGYVWTVDLREDMKWDDGTPITAESYVNSAKFLIDPEMKNEHADGLFSGDAPLVGAKDYFDGKGEWENVGIYASGKYQLTFIFAIPQTEYQMNEYGGSFLVHEKLYTDGMQMVGDLKTTNYNTTVETGASFGPYKLVSAEPDKQLVFTRNENWFGWYDSAFDDLWHMTDIVIEVVSEAATQLLLFNQGKLDRIRLGADSFATYRFSDYLVQWETTNLYRYVFNSDLEALKSMEKAAGDGYNRQVLSLDDFRRAISFSIDRIKMNQQATAGWVPSVVLVENYYYDIENDKDSKFRDSEPAMQSIVDFYGFSYGEGTPYKTLKEAYDAITGYNLNLARELFQSAYEQAIEQGIYTDGQQVNIQLYAGAAALSATSVRQQDMMQEFLTDATKGTGFEGLVSLTYVGNYPDRGKAIAEGKIEAIYTAWGGDIFNPFGLMGVYTNVVDMGGTNRIAESGGWNPGEETLTLTYDFFKIGTPVELTMTFTEWHQSITGTGIFNRAENLHTRMYILAYLEAGVLASYQTIPWGLQTISELQSMKVNFPGAEYNPVFDVAGPIWQLTFNYSDAEWDAFVTSKGGSLNYE